MMSFSVPLQPQGLVQFCKVDRPSELLLALSKQKVVFGV